MKTLHTSLTPSEDSSLSPAAIAARWQCSVMTVKRRIKAGALTAQKNGRLVRVPLSEILRFERDATI